MSDDHTPKTIDLELAKRFSEDPKALGLSTALSKATSITDDAAELLSKHEGSFLFLNSVTELSDAAAESLSKFHGSLYLQGLTEISNEVAKFLGNSAATQLLLRGIGELSDAAAAHLASHRADATTEGSRLDLNGLQSLSPEAAYHLGTHVGYTSLTGLKSLPDEVAESLAKGIRNSERRAQDYVNLNTYGKIDLSEFAALTLSEVLGFVILGKDKEGKPLADGPIAKALKVYAQAEASLKPKETAEVRDILSWSDCPTEIREALEKLEKMGANEADWLKVMFSKNTLRRLMKINPENEKYDFDKIEERQPTWQALAEYLGKYPKTLEWFKWEALKYFKHGDFAPDLAHELTPELAPVVGYGTWQNGIDYYRPEISEEKAALFSTLACPIRFYWMPRLRPETIRALTGHRARKEFGGVIELGPESAEALSHCAGRIRFSRGCDLLDLDEGKEGPYMKLSDESAFILAKGRFEELSLEIQPISEQAAKALAGNPRIYLHFPPE
jgi:hypothetical protein